MIYFKHGAISILDGLVISKSLTMVVNRYDDDDDVDDDDDDDDVDGDVDDDDEDSSLTVTRPSLPHGKQI